MKHISKFIIPLCMLGCFTPNVAENNRQQPSPSGPYLVGGPCEGCEAVLEYGDRELSNTVTMPEYREGGPRLKVSGVVYKKDGRTPAADVILYLYQTNTDGIYPTRGDETGWGRRHGYIRSWLKTNTSGEYTFYTLKPGSYPNRNAPAHIHMTVLEPDGKYYYLEDYFFKGDPHLEGFDLNDNPRGGEGYILAPESQNGILVASRDIVLGENVPGYE